MGLQLVAQGGALDLPNLSNLNSYFAEGDKTEMQVDLRLPLSGDVLGQIQQQLVNQGVALWDNVQQAGNTLIIRSQVAIAPWVIIGAVLTILAIILIVSWRVYKVIETFVGSLAAPFVFGIVGLIVLSFVMGD